ncbi:MAG: PAS domain S-box protein [Caldilineaceae bacterium]|nr:PAS domain S-box protein [Caldilineaceae bacterium]
MYGYRDKESSLSSLPTKDSAEHFRLLVEGIQDYAIFMLDCHGNVLTWNAGAEQIKGYAAPEILGQHFSCFYRPSEVAQGIPQQHLRQAVQAGRNEDNDWRVRKDGSLFWANCVLTALYDETGQLQGFAKVTRDITQRHYTEQRVVENERLLSQLIVAANDAILLADEQQQILLFNPAAERLFRCSAISALGQPLERFIPERFRTVHRAHFHTLTRSNGHHRKVGKLWVTYAVRADGEEVPVEASLAQIEVGGRQFFMVISRDISQRIQNEAALRDRLAFQEQLARLVAMLPGALCTFARRPNGSYEMPYASPAVEEIYGLDPHLILADASLLFRLIHPDDAALICGAMEEAARDHSLWSAEYRVQHPQKGEIWVEAVATPEVEPDGTIFWHSFMQDITVRKQNEAALHASEQSFRDLADAMPHIVFVTNPQGKFLYMSRHAREILIPIIHGQWLVIFHPEDRALVASHWQQALSTGQPFELEHRVQMAWGEYRWFLGRTVPIRNDAGMIIKWYGTATDIHDQKIAEAAVREAKRTTEKHLARMQTVMATILDGLIVTDATGKILEMNQTALQRYGFKDIVEAHAQAEALNLEFALYTASGEPIPPTMWPLRRVLQGEVLAAQEVFIRRTSTGQESMMSISGAPVRGADGAIELAVLTYHDVTERRRAETELRRTTELLRAVTDGTTDAVFVKDRQGRYLLFNPAAAQFVGRSANEALGRDDSELFSLESARRIKERDQWVMNAGQAIMTEDQLTAAGVTRTYFSTKAPYRDEQGNIIGVIGVSRDVTARKQAEDALQASEKRLHLALLAAQLGAWEWEREQGVIFCSPQCYAIFGVERFDDALDSFVRLIHPDDFERVLAALGDAMTKKQVYTVEFRIVLTNGEIRWISTLGQGTYDEAGNLVRVIGTVQDITQRVQLEEQLRQSQKMEAVGRLAGGVAHDFNNLLTVINGYSDLLLTKLSPDDRNRNFVANIQHAGERAAALTRQLLAFSRKQLLNPRIINLNEVIADIETMLTRLIGEDILLTTVLSPTASSVKVDPHQIEQVVINLAVNARDAMPQGGRLTIETCDVELDEAYSRLYPECKAGRYVQLTVIDTGCGMSADVKAHIFEPFFTTKSVGKGTGLGLATVFGIIKQSDGHITVHSEVNVGSCFTIYLPVVAPSSGPMPPTLESAPVLHGTETILLVEDEDAVRQIAKLALEMHGYQVLEASNGRQALALFEQHLGPLHLLVTDVIMPEMSGRQLAQQLQHRLASLKILFMSGYIEDVILQQEIMTFKDAFLHKPFSPLALTKKVYDVLRKC